MASLSGGSTLGSSSSSSSSPWVVAAMAASTVPSVELPSEMAIRQGRAGKGLPRPARTARTTWPMVRAFWNDGMPTSTSTGRSPSSRAAASSLSGPCDRRSKGGPPSGWTAKAHSTTSGGRGDRAQQGPAAEAEGHDGDVDPVHLTERPDQAGRGVVVQDPAPQGGVAALGDQHGDLGVGADQLADGRLGGGQQVAVGGVDHLQGGRHVDPGPQRRQLLGPL